VTPNTRGMLGEIQLELLIRDVIPSTMYTFQYTLSNRKRVDCMLHLPAPIGNISIDSKFPTFNTTSSFDDTGASTTDSSSSAAGSQQQQQTKKEIRDKLQKHISDIATKYIIPGETSQHAICFIPSVTLFLDIINFHTEILFMAHKQNIWITCPTTLLAVLTTIQGIARGQAIAKQTDSIFALMNKLTKDIDLLVNRFESAEKSIDRTRAELSKMQISVHKIQKVKMELDVLSQTTIQQQQPDVLPSSIKMIHPTNTTTLADSDALLVDTTNDDGVSMLSQDFISSNGYIVEDNMLVECNETSMQRSELASASSIH
jgi:DNA recombination protein RmuC